MVASSAVEPAVRGEPHPKSAWLYAILGVVLIIVGTLVLGDVVFTSALTATFIAWAFVIVGIFQLAHALGAYSWKGFVLDLLLGLLYIAAGTSLLYDPIAAAIKLTLLLGIIFIASGVFRMILASKLWSDAGGSLFLSGLVAVAAGSIIIAEWPQSGLWVLGLCLAADLIFHGFAWISYALAIPAKQLPQTA